MNITAHVVFVCRCLLQLICYLLRQLPVSYDVRVDEAQFLGSITYVNEEGERMQVPPWPEAPDVNHERPGRKEARSRWEAHRERVWKFLPQVAFRMLEDEKNDGSSSDPLEWEDEEAEAPQENQHGENQNQGLCSAPLQVAGPAAESD
jgi:hypothetical protein